MHGVCSGCNWFHCSSKSLFAIMCLTRSSVMGCLYIVGLCYVQFHIHSKQRIEQILLGSCSTGGNGQVKLSAYYFSLFLYQFFFRMLFFFPTVSPRFFTHLFRQIATAVGPCGNNRDYLFLLEKAMSDIGEFPFLPPDTKTSSTSILTLLYMRICILAYLLGWDICVNRPCG